MNGYIDIARCKACGKIRWLTPRHVREYGYGCLRCGDPRFVNTPHVGPIERLVLLRWYLWEHFKANPGWKWWKHPYELCRGIKAGLTIQWGDQP